MISVLYVDDEPGLLEITRRFLERSGEFTVTPIMSAGEALRVLREGRHDAIVSDYQMPEMDGIAFLKALRASGDLTPFIIFSGKGREEVVIEALNNGADFYIQKGGDPLAQFAELANKIHHAVKRRRAEEALKESREQLALAIEGSGVGLWDWYVQTGKTMFNERWAAIVGYTLAELSPVSIDTWINLCHPDDLQISDELMKKHFSKQLPRYECEVRMRHKDGHWVWVLDRGRVVEWDNNSNSLPIRMTGTHLDISERKRTEEEDKKTQEELAASYEQLAANDEKLRQTLDQLTRHERNLRESEQVLSAIVMGSPVPQFVIDRNHRILHWNQALEEYSGISADEVTGTNQHWRAFYSEERPCMADLLVDGAIEKIQQWYSGKFAKSRFINGAYEATDFFPKIRGGTWLYFTAAPIRDLNGTVIGAVETLEDITERKEGERELLKRNEELTASYEQIAATEEELRQNLDEIVTGQRLLKEIEEKYRTIFENTGTATVVIEENNIISLANAEFAKLSGFSKEDIEGKMCWTEFVVKEDLERMLAQHRLRRQDRETALTHYEFRFVTKSGDIRNIYLSIDVIPGTKKSVASLMDITERKRTEELYQTIFENTGTAMIILEEDTTISRVNDEMEKMWGYSREEIEGRVKWPTLVAEEDLEKMLEYHRLRRTDPDSAPRNYEFRFIHKNGEFRDAALTAAMIPGTKKSVISLRDITEFKKTELALRESEEKYRDIFEKSVLGLFRSAPDGRLINANDALARLYGYSGAAEMLAAGLDIGRQVYANPKDRNKFHHILAENGIVENYETLHLKQDGTRFWVSIAARAIQDREGNALFYEGTCIDITDRKRADEELRIQHNLALALTTCHTLNEALELLLDTALQGECLDSGGIYLAHPVTGALDLVVHRGLSPGFIEYVSHFDADAPQVQRAKTGTPFYGRYADLRQPGRDEIRDREGVTALASIPVLHGGNLGAIMNMASHVHDDIPVHTRQLLETLAAQIGGALAYIRSEEVLRKERDFTKNIVGTVHSIVLILDTEGHIVYINPYMEEISGYILDEVKGMDWFETFLPTRTRESTRSLFRKAIGGIQTRGNVDVIITKDGRERLIDWYDKVLRGADGSIEGLLATGQDITDKKRGDKALREANKRLSLLSGITSHDINNQLMVIRVNLELAQEYAGNGELAGLIAKMDSAARKIQDQIGLAQDYRDIGIKSPEWQRVSDALKGAKADRLPLSDECPGLWLCADPMLTTVFSNLMDNTIRHGESAMQVRVSCRLEERGGLTLIWEDDGRGVPREDKDLIFEKNVGSNTGLGLFLIREILAITGITITETGEPGKGARFEMTVPAGMYRYAPIPDRHD